MRLLQSFAAAAVKEIVAGPKLLSASGGGAADVVFLQACLGAARCSSLKEDCASGTGS